MNSDPPSPVSDKERFLLGAGFAFGVVFAMFVLAVVAISIVERPGEGILATELLFTIGAGILFTSIVGVSLYVLAFPENRLEVTVGEL